MIPLSTIINTFHSELLNDYGEKLLPSHHQALKAMKLCRTSASPMMLAQCNQCANRILAPHSCGHRNCPHCQHHDSHNWLERQLTKQVPADYFLLTFTLPEQLRSLAWQHQRLVYTLMIRCSWETVRTFAHNDKHLQGVPGAISVLHTHSRRLDYHPHVHLVMPAAAIDATRKLWRTKTRKRRADKKASGYLFNHKNLAKVFRAKLLDALAKENVLLRSCYPKAWVADVKFVGRGEKALAYLARYLYRGVIQENDIIACDNDQVTFRYRDSKTRQFKYRTLSGAKFLWLILRHVLPRRFRRARNFGFLHPNSKRLITLLHYLLKVDPQRALVAIKQRPHFKCPSCGAVMKIVNTRIRFNTPTDAVPSASMM